MSTENENQAPEKGFSVVHQFVKDLSFENLLSVKEMLTQDYTPTGEISFNMNSTQIQDDVFDMTLSIKIEAKDEEKEKSVYLLEAEYAGIIQIEGFEEEERNAVLIIEGGRMLFPYLRAIISDATREGGFNALVLQPIDFVALFMQQQQQGAENTEEETA